MWWFSTEFSHKIFLTTNVGPDSGAGKMGGRGLRRGRKSGTRVCGEIMEGPGRIGKNYFLVSFDNYIFLHRAQLQMDKKFDTLVLFCYVYICWLCNFVECIFIHYFVFWSCELRGVPCTTLVIHFVACPVPPSSWHASNTLGYHSFLWHRSHNYCNCYHCVGCPIFKWKLS